MGTAGAEDVSYEINDTADEIFFTKTACEICGVNPPEWREADEGHVVLREICTECVLRGPWSISLRLQR